MFIAVAISAVLIAAFVGLENYLFDGVYGATATLFIFPILLAVVFRLIWGKRAIFPGLLLGLMVGWIYTAGLIGTMKL